MHGELQRLGKCMPLVRAVKTVANHPKVTNTITYYDFLGRIESTCRPAFGVGWLVTSNFYAGATSRIIRTSRTGDPDTLCLYDETGELITTVLDVNGDGLVSYDGSDRITSNFTSYELDASNVLWRVNTQSVWLEDFQNHSTTTATTRVRLNGLGTTAPVHLGLPPGYCCNQTAHA